MVLGSKVIYYPIQNQPIPAIPAVVNIFHKMLEREFPFPTSVFSTSEQHPPLPKKNKSRNIEKNQTTTTRKTKQYSLSRNMQKTKIEKHNNSFFLCVFFMFHIISPQI